MHISRIKLLLWIITATAAGGAVVAIATSLLLPLEPSTETSGVSPSHAPKNIAGSPTPAVPPLESFAPAWRLPLRRPLVDPPAPVVVDADKTAQPAALAVRLIGTIVNGQHSRGVFLTGLSTVELKSIGDTVGGASVLSIDSNSATLCFQGETVTLLREKAPFDPSGESYETAAPANAPGQ
jgi:hypothetical protein